MCFVVKIIYLPVNYAEISVSFVSNFAGYEIGCVSSERMLKTDKALRKLQDTISLLKSVKKPMSEWRKIFQLSPSKSSEIKRYFL